MEFITYVKVKCMTIIAQRAGYKVEVGEQCEAQGHSEQEKAMWKRQCEECSEEEDKR